MTKTLAEARDYVAEVATATIPPHVQPFVLPAATALATVRQELPADSPVLLGAQNAHWAPEGAWTGEVSMGMVRDAGATIVEIGHSERRENFAETDETVARKVRACLDAQLVPLLCVGEPAAVREARTHLDFVIGQVTAGLRHLAPAEVPSVLVAYEPIWAIGESGRPPVPEETEPVMRALSEHLCRLSDGSGARALLYGGSVNLDNAAEILGDPHTDGLFVGRAAWQPEGLLSLLALASAAARRPAGSRAG